VTEAAVTDDQLCTFVVGTLLLGVPVSEVSEVVSGGTITPVPLAKSAVVGLLNLRGQIVPAVDARARFGLAPRTGAEEPTHVILRLYDERVSLVVDSASDVVTVPLSEREEVPETVNPQIRRLLTASYQRPGALMLVLDPSLVLDHL
jgi:purine-binding chemotaxis protein CheW